MKIKSIIAVLSISLFCFSAKAATFNISTSSSYAAEGIEFPVLNGSIDLLDGQTDMTNAGTLSATRLANSPPFDGDFNISDTVTVQSGGETLMMSGDFLIHVDNIAGPLGSFSLLSDMVFDFSFGQLTLLAGNLGTVFCDGCAIGETTEGDAYFTAHYSEISVVPLPAGFPMMAGGLALLGYLGWRRKRANP